MKPRTLRKVCGGWWWGLRVILVLSFGLSQAEQQEIQQKRKTKTKTKQHNRTISITWELLPNCNQPH